MVHTLAGDAVAVASIGILTISMYDCYEPLRRVSPHWLLTSAVGWIPGSNLGGSALVPFMVGGIASKAGIATLHPV